MQADELMVVELLRVVGAFVVGYVEPQLDPRESFGSRPVGGLGEPHDQPLTVPTKGSDRQRSTVRRERRAGGEPPVGFVGAHVDQEVAPQAVSTPDAANQDLDGRAPQLGWSTGCR